MIAAYLWETEESWHGQLRDVETGRPEGTVFNAVCRGAVIGQMRMRIPLTHLRFVDCYEPPVPSQWNKLS